MWVYLNNAFLSIVEDRADSELLIVRARLPGDIEALLIVRARLPGDIEAVIPGAFVKVTTDADYRYRATVPRHWVVEAMARAVERIDYPNFKGSLPRDFDGMRDLDMAEARRVAYHACWAAMVDMQNAQHAEQDGQVSEAEISGLEWLDYLERRGVGA
jgi:hypothetical protein